MIPESWLKERLETTNLGELLRQELTRCGFSEADVRKMAAEGPSPQWREKWRVFIGQKTAGDELWYFESPLETWKNDFAGRAGYALVRAGHIVDSLVTRKS